MQKFSSAKGFQQEGVGGRKPCSMCFPLGTYMRSAWYSPAGREFPPTFSPWRTKTSGVTLPMLNTRVLIPWKAHGNKFYPPEDSPWDFSPQNRAEIALLCSWKSSPGAFSFSLPWSSPVLHMDTSAQPFPPKISFFSWDWSQPQSPALLSLGSSMPGASGGLIAGLGWCKLSTLTEDCIYIFGFVLPPRKCPEYKKCLQLGLQHKSKIISSISCYRFLFKPAWLKRKNI